MSAPLYKIYDRDNGVWINDAATMRQAKRLADNHFHFTQKRCTIERNGRKTLWPKHPPQYVIAVP